MSALTKTMLSILRDIAGGAEVQRHFDVWGPKPDGHWWQYRQGAPIRRQTIEGLVKRGLIACGDEVRPYGGRRVATYALTDAGRATLPEPGGGK